VLIHLDNVGRYPNHKTDKLLIAILCIDRDAKYISKQIARLENISADILIVTRDSDIKTISQWSKVNKVNNVVIKTIPHYVIRDRHNFDKIVEKRNLAIQYAIDNMYDALLFLDSDVVITSHIFDLLRTGLTYYDICLAPYVIKWLNYPALGFIENNEFIMKRVCRWYEGLRTYRRCAIGTLGCTMISRRVFTNIKTEYKRLTNKYNKATVSGEDVGFFINALHEGYKTAYITQEVSHL
jgi:hypothetical protein